MANPANPMRFSLEKQAIPGRKNFFIFFRNFIAFCCRAIPDRLVFKREEKHVGHDKDQLRLATRPVQEPH